jgi:hypothetical protein
MPSGASIAGSPARVTTAIAGSMPRRLPTCRCQVESQSKLWKAVPAAWASKARHTGSAASKLS